MLKRNKGYLFVILFSLSCLCFANQFNESFVIEEKKINLQLAQAFPIRKSYDGITAVFSAPAIKIDVLDKTVKLNVLITTEDGDRKLKAKGQLIGKVEYYDFEKTLRFRNPKLDSFIIIEDTLTDNKAALKAIKQTIGNTLPDLTLYNLEDLDFNLQFSEPKEIEISINRLVLHWGER